MVNDTRAPGRPVLVLRHAPWEGPGLIAEALAGVPIEVRTVVDDAAPDLPRPQDLAGLVVMGGWQDADDDAGHPGLRAERDLLARAVDADMPVLGVCLGMQLLALALGAPLHRRHGTEIGFGPVDVVGEDPVLAPLGAAPHVLHWHSDAVDLPRGATLLARTDITPVQAFRAGSALGLQFHVEVDAGLLSTWLAEPGMTTGLPPSDVDRMRADGARLLPGLTAAARAGLAAFSDSVRDRG